MAKWITKFGILRKRNRVEAYRRGCASIEDNKEEFGLLWLLKQLGIWVNSYYSWIKGKEKRAEREERKQEIMQEIKEIYHNNDGTPGYRTMQVYLERCGINLSVNTVHEYVNRE